MPPSAHSQSAQALVSSILRELSSIHSPPSNSKKRKAASLDSDTEEHISDSEASSSSSSSSAAAHHPLSKADEAAASTTTDFLDHPRTKPLLATLHCLLPNYLLPALDVLDRRLVTRLASPSSSTSQTQPGAIVYYVRSLGTTTEGPDRDGGGGGGGDDNGPLGYEVRLRAWHCTCAAFAFACAEHDAEGPQGEADDSGYRDASDSRATAPELFGGLYRVAGARSPPLCKHLLAGLLAETCLPLRAHVNQRDVSVEEMAGWAAGWI